MLQAGAVVAVALAAVVAGPQPAGAGDPAATPLTAIEYHHPLFDHYFVTASAHEIQALNSGQFSGWVPTGFSFPVLPPELAQAGTAPVCRFFGGPIPDRVSHFYSSSESECDEVLQRFPSWMLESRNVFRVHTPDATGSCPAGSRPVRRLYNQREDANHRYTDDDIVAAEMELKGYVPEGYGSGAFPTAFCAPIPNPAVACRVAASESRPTVGSTLTLTATCSGDPASYRWVGCTGTGDSCTTTSMSTGAKAYVLFASAGDQAGTPSVVSVVWQPADPNENPNPSPVSCLLVATNTNPAVNSDVTLTASCSGNPTRYSWNGCTSSTNTCVVRASSAGAVTYSMSAASGSAPFSAATSIILNWKPLLATIACSVVTSNAQPTVNTNVTISASCSGNPTSYTWSGCTSSGPRCTATSATSGPRVYSVVANNGSASSAVASVVVNWQTAATTPRPACTLATSNTQPPVNTSVTLTASCTGNPTSFAWTGCASTTATCTTTSAAAGDKSYSVTATNAGGSGAPATLTINWKTATPPSTGPVSCTLGASNALPIVNTPITLTANCTGTPTAYTWTGCTSTTASCTTTSAATGARTYSVVGRNATSTAAAASTTVTWQPVPPVPAGMPTSADFILRASDPRGGDNGYNTFKRLPNGKGITFGGFSHNRSGNNSVAVYDPMANSWQVVVPHTPWVDTTDVTGRSFLGNRDNHNTIVVGSRNEFWVMSGQRGMNLIGNWRGVLNTQSWSWQINDDFTNFAPVGGEVPNWINSAAGWIDLLNVGYIFGGATSDNPYDGLIRIEPNPSGPAPYKFVKWADAWNKASFPGAEKLRYISNSHFVRNGKVYVYGGGYESRINNVRSPGRTLYEIDVMAPSMRAVSVNTLPDGQRVESEAILADRDPAKDILIATDGVRVNVYDFASGAWVNVPVNTAHDAKRLSPSSDGAGRQGFWSPEVGQYIILGGAGRTYGLKLNYGSAPPPPPTAVSCTLSTSNAFPVVNTNITLTASCTGAPTSYTWTGCSSTGSTCTATSASSGAVVYSVVARNATSTSAVASVTVTWQPTQNPPPPPPSSTGTLKVTATAVPYTGNGTVFGNSKHLDFARLSNRWYKMVGDHTAIDPLGPVAQSGRQEILSFNAAANDFRVDQMHYIWDPAQVQVSLPDDAFTIVRNDEAWVFVSTRTAQHAQPSGAAQQLDKVMAWKPGRGWRVVRENLTEFRGNRAWRGMYDPVRDRFIIPALYNGLNWILIGGDGSDQTQRSSTGAAYTYGNHSFSVAGIVPDLPKRVAYLYDHVTAELWSVNLDTLALTKLGSIPEPSANGQAAIKIAWHPDLRAVIIGATQLHAYEVDTGKRTTWARPDGFVNGIGHHVTTSTLFFDPDTRDIVSIGTLDWDTGMNPGTYWRLRITQ
jgi:hypothetical protein